ncbi:MAG: hypothetical protein AOA65_0094 [Candidatus Bathyarchaeota archaeon BA1]|nr:MAG: hypothetical protein AOA65_0094 [Candidatus Bathyarchaeota archaeon BA1]
MDIQIFKDPEVSTRRPNVKLEEVEVVVPPVVTATEAVLPAIRPRPVVARL